jgi:RNA polymerase sigma factor (sigma-70 family)
VTAKFSHLLRGLCRGMAAEALADQSDRELVARFLTCRDETVFEAFVRRHGPMVYRVCWRVLQHAHDAEDAFQATFLLLAQKLPTVRNRDSLASWLHGVAQRAALKAKTQAAKRRRHEKQASVSRAVPPDDVPWRELRTMLDAELAQLPEKWRLPLILCYLEGRTQDEAAAQLRCSKSTFFRRLDQARAALGRRLTRKGLVGPAALSAVLLSDCVASAALPPELIRSTAQAAAGVATGNTAPAGMISAKVAALTEGVLQAMLVTKLKIAAAVLLALSVVITGAAALAVPVFAERQSTRASGTAQQPGNKDADSVKASNAAGAARLARADRTIKKEPAYQGQPKYCLLVFGPQAKDRVWLVLDGDTLYVDRNGNGDLTEAGEHIPAPAFIPSKDDDYLFARERSIEVGDISVGGLTHTGLVLKQAQYRRKPLMPNVPGAQTPQELQEHVDKVWKQVPDGIASRVYINLDTKCYGLFGDTKGQQVKHMAWMDRNGVLAFADRPQDAPVIHFGGRLTLYLRPGEKLFRGQELEATDVFTGAETAFWLGTPGLGAGTFTIMQHDLVPKDVHPLAEIRFPAKAKDGQPVVQRFVLKSSPENAFFFSPVQVPKEVGLGMAKVTTTFTDWREARVAPATADLPVVDAAPQKSGQQ